MEENKNKGISITPEVARGVYSNLVFINHSNSEFVLDFIPVSYTHLGSATLLAHRVERLLAPAPAMPTSARQRYLTVLMAGGLASGVVQIVAHSPLLPSLHCLVESLVPLALSLIHI